MRATAILILALSFGACTSAQDRDATRRQAYVHSHPGTSAEVAASILRGHVILGMSFEEVVATLGPVSIDQQCSTGTTPLFSGHSAHHSLTFMGQAVRDSFLISVRPLLSSESSTNSDCP